MKDTFNPENVFIYIMDTKVCFQFEVIINLYPHSVQGSCLYDGPRTERVKAIRMAGLLSSN